ncbi:MAG: division/cell wall cluster transcriptional repressor MraZ [Erysipelotrichaceae bacterium]|jgi:MraZ protein|nr:division/cell wall cluster transcriptional repressor MraZ [Erysipelotrichaceae bacterium]
MFFGLYEHSIDEKNRLMVPRKMRDEAGVKLFIMKGYDGALSIYKANAFEKLVAETESLPFNMRNSRDYVRAMLASACEIDVDRQGRIQIPTTLMNKYNITRDVVIIGVGDHFEVWSKQAYEEYEKRVNDSFESIAENLPTKN